MDLVTRMVAVAIERKRAEAALRESEKRFRHVLLVQAESLVSESLRKDEFLAMLAHELRNPLAPIRNSISILQRSDPSQPVARSVLLALDPTEGWR